MILPSWSIERVWLGPIPLSIWGLFVALGFLVGIVLAKRWAPRRGVAPNDVLDVSTWVILASMIGARLGHVVLYAPAYYLTHPWEVLRIWEGGLSSFGGFLGALIAVTVFIHRRHIPFLRLSDVLLGPFALGWFIGRLGCYSIHDHPGMPCSGFLCVPFPDGTRRLDMGLLDGLLALTIFACALIARRRLEPKGRTTAFVIGCYGIGRFLLDFLRVGDATYAGLTPAQIGSLALVVASAGLVIRLRPPTPAV